MIHLSSLKRGTKSYLMWRIKEQGCHGIYSGWWRGWGLFGLLGFLIH